MLNLELLLQYIVIYPVAFRSGGGATWLCTAFYEFLTLRIVRKHPFVRL